MVKLSLNSFRLNLEISIYHEALVHLIPNSLPFLISFSLRKPKKEFNGH